MSAESQVALQSCKNTWKYLLILDTRNVLYSVCPSTVTDLDVKCFVIVDLTWTVSLAKITFPGMNRTINNSGLRNIIRPWVYIVLSILSNIVQRDPLNLKSFGRYTPELVTYDCHIPIIHHYHHEQKNFGKKNGVTHRKLYSEKLYPCPPRANFLVAYFEKIFISCF